jgi:hypothetical protein
MPLALDTSAITHGIQLAVAPVFLLTAVSGMIGVVAGRLARIIDRARVVEERARREPESSEQAVQELLTLRRRGYLANAAIALAHGLCLFHWHHHHPAVSGRNGGPAGQPHGGGRFSCWGWVRFCWR